MEILDMKINYYSEINGIDLMLFAEKHQSKLEKEKKLVAFTCSKDKIMLQKLMHEIT